MKKYQIVTWNEESGFDEFYNNEWQDDDCREWYVNINIQNK